MDPMTMAALGSLAGGLGGGGSTKVSQTLNNQNSSLVSFSTVTNVGGGGVTGTTAPGTTSQNATASASNGTDTSGGYSPALPIFDSPTTVPDMTTDTGMGFSLAGLPVTYIAGAALAMFAAVYFMGGRK